MSAISDTFRRLRRRNSGALIAYVMAGYPDYGRTVSAVRGIVRGGADIIELGFPFSDPLADGPAIQEAATASLQNGMSPESYYRMVDEIRAFTDVPLLMMTYSNVAHAMGYERFAARAARHRIDGIILPDMPVGESGLYREAASSHGVDTVFLASPNTANQRCSQIMRASSGFLYLVAVYGTTGARSGVQKYGVEALRRIKQISQDLPVGVGFGISRGEDVRRYIEAGADAAIVGSAILNIIKESPDDTEGAVATYVASLKRHTSLE